jgi:hypothetical protein
MPMPFTAHRSKQLLLTILFLVALLVSACAAPGVPAATRTPTTSPEPTAEPTATSTPIPADKVVLVGAPNNDAQLFQSIEAEVKSLAAQSSLVVDEQPALQPGQLGSEAKVAVLLSPPANLGELLSRAPQTQFVVLSDKDLDAAPNLSVIRVHSEYVTFTAGYISVMVASDWRAGGMLPSDTALGGSLSDAFVNGGHYFCGVCNSFYAPVTRFPLVQAQPSGSGLAAWQQATAAFAHANVYMIYVAPEVSSPELLQSLVDQSFFLLGGSTPAPEILPRWVATIRSDSVTPLAALWPDLVAGKGGKVVSAGIALGDIQSGILSDGKQLLVQRMLKDLTDGMILPFNPPLE